jgi:hypothetical protein
MKHLTIIFSLFFVTSCAIHSAKTPPQILQAPKGSEYVDIAVGYSKATYFLDIGGMGKVTLINDAKRRLFSFPLSAGQTFDNLTLDTKTTFIGPYIKRQVILTADVVQKDTFSEFTFSDYYKDLTGTKSVISREYLSVNEKIIYIDNSRPYYGRVLNLEGERPVIYYIDGSGALKIGKRSWNNIFKIVNTEIIQKEVGFSLGDKVSARVWNQNGEKNEITGKIIGLNWFYALIESPYVTSSARIQDLVR